MQKSVMQSRPAGVCGLKQTPPKTKPKKRDTPFKIEGISPDTLRNRRDTLPVLRRVLESFTPQSNLYTALQLKALCSVVDRSFYEKVTAPEFEKFMGKVRKDNGHITPIWGHPDTIANLKEEGILL